MDDLGVEAAMEDGDAAVGGLLESADVFYIFFEMLGGLYDDFTQYSALAEVGFGFFI